MRSFSGRTRLRLLTSLFLLGKTSPEAETTYRTLCRHRVEVGCKKVEHGRTSGFFLHQSISERPLDVTFEITSARLSLPYWKRVRTPEKHTYQKKEWVCKDECQHDFASNQKLIIAFSIYFIKFTKEMQNLVLLPKQNQSMIFNREIIFHRLWVTSCQSVQLHLFNDNKRTYTSKQTAIYPKKQQDPLYRLAFVSSFAGSRKRNTRLYPPHKENGLIKHQLSFYYHATRIFFLGATSVELVFDRRGGNKSSFLLKWRSTLWVVTDKTF